MSRVEFSKATRLAVWDRAAGRCEKCGADIRYRRVEYHHVKECTFGGDASPENCQLLCTPCHSFITRDRAAVIAKSNRVRQTHIGVRKRRGFRGWRRFNGEVVYNAKD